MAKEKKWLSSKEALKTAKIQSCDIMNYRIKGNLEFKKQGNVFFLF